MDGWTTQSTEARHLVREAEALLRALRGVADACVRGSEDRIESVRITAVPGADPRLAAQVRSALLAGLAAPLDPTRIYVRRPDEPGAHSSADRCRNGALGGPDAPPDVAPAGADAGRPERGESRPVGAEPTDQRDQDDRPITARPRLIAVDLHRPGDGRVVCRITVAHGTDVQRAEAVAVDLPGAAAQAAAQATVRALVAAGLQGLELNGLREVEIAGRDYVVVALRRTDDQYTRIRSGSATVFGSPERSAAEATVAAANIMI